MKTIDENALIKKLEALQEKENKNLPFWRGYNTGLNAAIIAVQLSEDNNAPRRHGHWIGKPIAGYANVRCSVCGMVFRQNTGEWKSCPECTAIMDEVIKNNER